MNKALRLILTLVLVCAGAGHAWARGGLTIITVSPNPVGGTIEGFYSDADCSQSITDEGFEPPLSIYFRATPDNDHELGTADENKVVSFIKSEVVMTGDAQQARHRAINDGQAGWFIDVKESGNGVYYFTIPNDFDKTIMAIRVTATFPKSIAYAVLTDNNDGIGTKTLTFKYEEHTVSGTNEWDVSNTDGPPGWYNNRESITKVVFESTFANARPKSCSYWFHNCNNLSTITGLNYLNTSEVTNMTAMFCGCSSLTSLDLSCFNTCMVDDMSHMFDGCSRLTSLSIGKDFTVIDFYDGDFHIITMTDGMFEGCTALAEGMLIVTGVPSIAQDIFSGVFTNGVLATPLTKDQLGIKETSSPYTWKGGKFKSVGKAKIPYIDADGKLHNDDGTKTPLDDSDDCADALPITSAYGDVSLGGGWYFVVGDVNIHNKLKFDGEAHLILCDNAVLAVTDEISNNNDKGNIIIYSQSTGKDMGKLTANCISTSKGDITINGGQVTATSSNTDGIGINGRTTINSGQVTATATGTGGNGIKTNSITINGGQVTATGTKGNGIKTSRITINGGQVTATGSNDGKGISSISDITLGWTNADDFILVSCYYTYTSSYSVKIADGKILQYGNNGTKLYEGDITTLAMGGTLNNVKLTPYGLGGYCGSTANNADGKNLTWEIPLVDHDNNAATPKQLSTVLSIEGTGDINDYSSADAPAPWKDCSVSLILVPTEDSYSTFGASLSPTDKAMLAPNEISLAKNASGWGTYCHNYPVSYSLSDGNSGNDVPKAYTVSGLSSDGKSVDITAATNNYAAPATPLLLGYKAPANNNDLLTLTAQPATAPTPANSDVVSQAGSNGVTFYGNLKGNLTSIPSDNYIADQTYVLRNGAFIAVESNDGIQAHRCWLTVSGTDARELSIGESGGAATSDMGHIACKNVEGGSLNFFANLDNASLNTEPLRITNGIVGPFTTNQITDRKVYVRAIPNAAYSALSVTFTAYESTESSKAQVRNRASGIVVGQAVSVAPVTGHPGIYCIVMPGNGNNVSLSATMASKGKNTAALSYVDGDGSVKTKAAGTVYILDGSETTLGTNGDESWYVCQTDLTYTATLTLSGTAHIILGNKSNMIVGSFKGTDERGQVHNLSVYGEQLPANATLNDIGHLDTKTLTDFNKFIINSGGVMAFDVDENDNYIGEISATNVTINGGFVVCMGTMKSTGSAGKTTLGWNNAATDRIRVSGFSGDVTLAKRFLLYASDIDNPDAILSTGAFTPPSGDMMLMPLDGNTVTVDDDGFAFSGKNGPDFSITTGSGANTVTTPYYIYKEGATVTVNVTDYGQSGVVFTGLPEGTTATTTAAAISFTMPGEDIVLTNVNYYTTEVSYVDADGQSTKTPVGSKVYILKGGGGAMTLPGGWYVVLDWNKGTDVNNGIDGVYTTLSFTGDAHLILADGAEVSAIIRASNANLTIYGQGGETEGLLTANGSASGDYFGINVSGDSSSLTINGGQVTASGSTSGIIVQDSSPILTINGGQVKANGGSTSSKYGIHVYATSGTASATINGGQVDANGGMAGIYAESTKSTADISLGWTNADDYIDASKYYVINGTVNIADGKIFQYGSSGTKLYEGDITSLAEGGALNNVKLTPYGVGGYCGKDNEMTTTVDESKNVTWEIPFVKDNSGNTVLGSILAINGTGAMADYTHYSTSSPDNFAPWIEPDHTYSYYLSGGLKYPSVTAVTIGSGVTTIGSDAFIYCPGITDVTIGANVTTLGLGALQSCLDLKNVTFAEGSQLTTIDNYAFGNCISLTAIDIPVGVTTIGEGAFSYCSGLTAITIPDGVTAIDMNTFMHCSNLSDVTIGSGVTTIGACAFEKCTSLTTITIPASVTTIYEYAFVTCPSLETVTIERYDSNTATNGGNPITTIDSSTFVECEALKLILVPSEDAYDAYSKADDGWTGDINDDGTGKTYKSMLAPNEIELAKSASGWSTFCHNYPVKYGLSDGNSGNDAPKAYTVSGLSSDGKSVDITAATDNHAAPATPLLLGYTGSGTITLTALPETATTPGTSVIADNGGTDVVFYGNTGNTALDATALTGGTTTYIYLFGNTEGRQSYVLSQGKFIPVISTDGGIAPHRCWLNVKGTAAARELSIGDGETTGIASMEDAGSEMSDAWYSLDGRKLNAAPTKQGVYVNGGRKVVIK